MTGLRLNQSDRNIAITCNLANNSDSFFNGRMLPLWPATLIGGLLTILASVICLRGLVQRIGHEHRVVKAILQVPGMAKVAGVG